MAKHKFISQFHKVVVNANPHIQFLDGVFQTDSDEEADIVKNHPLFKQRQIVDASGKKDIPSQVVVTAKLGGSGVQVPEDEVAEEVPPVKEHWKTREKRLKEGSK